MKHVWVGTGVAYMRFVSGIDSIVSYGSTYTSKRVSTHHRLYSVLMQAKASEKTTR